MLKKVLLLLVFSLFLCSFAYASDFYLHDNGVTIKCENATVGDTGVVDGITYTKRAVGSITTANADTTCTSGITDMSNLFRSASTFNSDIGHWDTSSVTTMTYMFNHANEFNQFIGYWNVSRVTNMVRMFWYATSFNQDLSGWCVNLIASHPSMFATSSALSIDNMPVWGTCPNINYDFYLHDNGVTIKCESADNNDVGIINDLVYTKRAVGDITTTNVYKTCTSGITSMSGLFHSAYTFNGFINDWDTSSVTDMSYMFYDANSFNQDISYWNTTIVTDMSGMFFLANNFNADIGDWDTSSVTTMESMFSSAGAFNQDISGWDTSNVEYMGYMFYYASSFNQNIGYWDVSSVTTDLHTSYGIDLGMVSMFENATVFNQDLSGWCVTDITSLPTNFDVNSDLDIDNRPVWGMCPQPDIIIVSVNNVSGSYLDLSGSFEYGQPSVFTTITAVLSLYETAGPLIDEYSESFTYTINPSQYVSADTFDMLEPNTDYEYQMCIDYYGQTQCSPLYSITTGYDPTAVINTPINIRYNGADLKLDINMTNVDEVQFMLYFDGVPVSEYITAVQGVNSYTYTDDELEELTEYDYYFKIKYTTEGYTHYFDTSTETLETYYENAFDDIWETTVQGSVIGKLIIGFFVVFAVLFFGINAFGHYKIQIGMVGIFVLFVVGVIISTIMKLFPLFILILMILGAVLLMVMKNMFFGGVQD